MPPKKTRAKSEQKATTQKAAKTTNKSAAKKKEPEAATTRATRSKTQQRNESQVSQPSRSASAAGSKRQKSQRKATASLQSRVSLISSGDDGETNVVFEKGTFVAFIDTREETEDRFEEFRIGKVVKDMLTQEATVSVQIFHKAKALNFALEDDNTKLKIEIFDYQIIDSVDAKPTADKTGLKITKATLNKVNKLMENCVEQVKAKINYTSSDEEEETDSEGSAEDEAEEADNMDHMKGRVVVKAKRRFSVDKKTTKTEEPAFLEKRSPSPKRAARPKRAAATQKAVKSAVAAKKVALKDEEMEEDDEKPELIDTSSRPASKRAAATSSSAVVKASEIGKKRKRPTASAASQPNEVTRKVKQLSDGSEEEVKQVKPRKKPTPKKPVVFKLGKWNPDTVIVEEEPEKMLDSDELITNCCLSCNTRNIQRAINTDNKVLLRKCVYDLHNIPSLTFPWSQDSSQLSQPLLKIFAKDDLKMMEIMLDIDVGKRFKDNEEYLQKRSEFYDTLRRQPKDSLLNRHETGRVSNKAYGTAIRPVEMSRGNRQGNNAFTASKWFRGLHQIPTNYWPATGASVKTFKAYSQLMKQNDNANNHCVPEFAKAGARDLVIHAIQPMIKHENYGFNKLHLDVLKLDKLTEKYHTASLTKKAVSAQNITPIHFACINPSTAVLKALLDQSLELNVQDSLLNRPLHFAAACVGSGPLELLLQLGANVFDVNGFKQTALHIAAAHRRAENISVLLKANPAIHKLRCRQGKNAMAYACENGDIESIKVLLDSGLSKVNTGCGKDRLPPLSQAAQQGNYELCEYLLTERKARTLSKDKYKRTPLIMAIRNGHVKVASLLLQHGSDWNHPDSSFNTPMHYAAAFGWRDCINLLLKHGADVNAMNSWKVSPITISMLMNHVGTVKRLLEEENVDVNGKDDSGRTLLALTLVDLSDPECLDFAQYLIGKGADPNIQDVDGLAPLHRLAVYTTHLNQWNDKDGKLRKQELKTQISMIKLLIANGADLNLKTEKGMTPFAGALANDEIHVMDILADNLLLSEDSELLHKFQDKIFDDRYKTILIKLLNKEDNLSADVMNVLDDIGFSPFLSFLQNFVQGLKHNIFNGLIDAALEYQGFRHGANIARYVITNKDLYDPDYGTFKEAFEGQRGTRRHIEDQEIVKNLKLKFLRELFLHPFIDFMRQLIKKGANPHAKVEKIKFYRELDKHKQTLELVNEAREGMQVLKEGQAQEQIDTKATGQVKLRAEVLAEQKVEKHLLRGKQGDKNDKKKQKTALDRVEKRLKEFYAEKKHQPRFEKKKNGELVEIQYDKEHGMQNAVHLAMESASKTVLNFLVDDHKVAFDEVDYQGRNPFMIACMNQQQETKAFERMIELGVNIDLPDKHQVTPFLLFYKQQSIDQAHKLLDLGANVNQMDNGGMFALKYALIRRQNNEISKLVEQKKAEINKLDHHGRNVLHHAVNMSSATADATFETEQLLIDLGVDINHKDERRRVPLHYAFVKMKSWKTATHIDPIEQVSSLCGQKGLEINVLDQWNKTPLHYAAQRGATISTLYILNRKADLEGKDIYGNTPLGIALTHNHFNYGIILIQKNADVKVPVFHEQPIKLEYERQQAEKKQRRAERRAKRQPDGDVEMKESDEDEMEEGIEESELSEDAEVKKHRQLFNKPLKFSPDDEYDSEDESSEEDTELESDDENEANAFNTQNAFGQNVFGSNTGGAAPKRAWATPAAKWNFQQQQQQQQQQAKKESKQKSKLKKSDVEIEKPSRSTFRVAIQAGQQGIAYLILDNKYDYMLAMEDALDEKKFQLVITLLAKTQDDEIVRQNNAKGQNLMHILAKNSSGGDFTHLRRIFDIFRKRGVNCFERDHSLSNALHYAVWSNCAALVSILLEEGIQVNEVNDESHTPLSIHLKGVTGANLSISPDGTLAANGLQKTIFQMLSEKGADMNHVYPEKSHKTLKRPIPLEQDYLDEEEKEGAKATETQYRCSPMINFVRHKDRKPETAPKGLKTRNLLELMSHGATFDILDSDERDVLIYSVIHNDKDLVNFFIQNAESHKLLIDQRDCDGKTAVHWCVSLAEFGSYENTALLEQLAAAGFNLNISDADGRTPIDYAKEQESGVMLRKLVQLMGVEMLDHSVERRPSNLPLEQWPQVHHDFESDSRSLLRQAEEKRAKEVTEGDQKESYVPIDVVMNSQKQYKVYYDEEGRPYDAYLAKVDLRNGPYGDYVFYKMQILHDTNRDLYIVLTRYGRIGEVGVNQRSPFNKVEDAKTEFHTIFKQKSANEWANAEDNFVKSPKKYALVKVHYSNVKHQDYLAPFDFENCAKLNTLRKQEADLYEEISNVTMYQRAISELGINTDLLPVSALTKDTLTGAKNVLAELSDLIKKLDDLKKIGLQADYEEVESVTGEISRVSSKYYELIPFSEGKDTITKPISSMAVLRNHFEKIETLSGVEYSTRILLGALYKQQEVHPIEYVHGCLNTQIVKLEKGSPEYDLIYSYTTQTSRKFKKLNIFKIDRKGESEKFEDFKGLGNRRLLFHGTSMTNLLGILGQGLRIAPPEAPATGYMFGKGIYFADMFKKSEQYTSGPTSKVMLLCEVALGKMKKLMNAEYVEKLDDGFSSVMGCGKSGPDYKNRRLVAKQGFGLPLGPEIEYSPPANWEKLMNKKDQQNQGGLFSGGFSQPSNAAFSVNATYQKKAAIRRPYGGGFGGFGGNPFGGGFGGRGFGAAQPTYWQLSHNEYIVYNTDQVKMKYILHFE